MFSRNLSICFCLFIKVVVITTNELPDKVDSPVEQQAKKDQCNITLKESLCTKPACVHAASSILQNMDMSVDPCDDFYQFACKNFIENTRIPDDKSEVTIFSRVSDKLEEQVYDVLESPVTEHDIRPFKLAKNFYSACMNKSLIDKIGTAYIKKLLKEFGGWPVIEGERWNESSFDWIESIYTSTRLGLINDYFIGFGVIVDYKNSSARTLVIDQANLALDRTYLIKGFEEKIASEYYKYMVDTAVLLGANRERATEELKLSTEFEMDLANISTPAEDQRDANKLYNPMKISELETRYPSIPWLSFIRTQMPNETIELDENVVVFSPPFLKKFEILVNNTPKRVLANYALGRIVKTAVPYLPDPFSERLTQFKKIQTGSAEKVPRWQECVRKTKRDVSFAVDAMYVRKYFNKESKTRALNMVNKIRSQVYKTLENADWMDNKTRAAALAKANAVVAHVAYPDELLDDSELTKYYENLDIGTHNYHEAKLNVSRFKEQYNLGLLRKPINKTDWIGNTLVTVVNAQYDRARNALLLSAGVLQGIIFNKDFPNYLNYGGIGIFIGHEITHGFDDRGRQFDKDGNLINWWYDETEKRFLEKANCFIQQYGNYTVKEINMNLNGFNSQGENIADNGGYKESYHAYTAWAQKNKREPQLPGLEMFSPKQMFWISAASLWCTVSRPEILRNRVKTAYHAPGEFRVIGPISNQEEFSKDFNCPVGSKMNPANKCRIW